MSLRAVVWLVGLVLGVVALAQLPCLVLALVLGEAWSGFALSIALACAAAAGCLLRARGPRQTLEHRASILAVALCALAACLSGSLPLVAHPDLAISLVDSVFEATSGFTTTGATVLTGLDQMPRSLLLWRALMHWLGGMGVVLLGVAILPILSLGGMQLLRPEAPGAAKDKLASRVVDTARVLWLFYTLLTLANAGLLLLGGMSFFDAICHAMSTVSTGGFSTHDASFAWFGSPRLQAITTIFMLLGGTSFVIQYRILTQGIRWSRYPELRAFIAIFAIGAALVAFDLRVNSPERYGDLTDALGHAAFQTAAVLTTTGFLVADLDSWPATSQAVVLGLFFVGGMAGSTAGGIKVIRVLVLVQLALSQFFRLVHPRGVGVLRLGERALDESVVLGVVGLAGLWSMATIAGTLLLGLFGSDVFTGFSAAAAALANLGPGFAGDAPHHAFSGFAPGAKLVLSALMLLGRLEIVALLVLLTPSFWRS